MIYVKVGNAIKEVKGVYCKVGNEIKRLFAEVKVSTEIKSFIQYTLQKTLNYSYAESSTQSNIHVFNIPNLISVDEITVNVGNVNFTVDVDNVTVVVNGASPTRSVYNAQKYNMVKTSSLTSSANSFPATIVISEDGYTGSISKNGTSTVISGAYVASDTKFVTNQPSSNYNVGGYVGTLTQYVSGGSYTPSNMMWVTNQGSSYYNDGTYSGGLNQYVTGGSYTPADSQFANFSISGGTSNSGYPSSYPYNSGGYTGTLSKSGSPYVWGTDYYGDDLWAQDYGGTIYRSAVDTRTYAYQGYVYSSAYDSRTYAYQGNVTKPASDNRVYGQNYSGVTYKGGNDDYYSYSIVMKYTV